MNKYGLIFFITFTDSNVLPPTLNSAVPVGLRKAPLPGSPWTALFWVKRSLGGRPYKGREVKAPCQNEVILQCPILLRFRARLSPFPALRTPSPQAKSNALSCTYEQATVPSTIIYLQNLSPEVIQQIPVTLDLEHTIRRSTLGA